MVEAVEPYGNGTKIFLVKNEEQRQRRVLYVMLQAQPKWVQNLGTVLRAAARALQVFFCGDLE
jgi:hypothetical protein